MQRPNGEGGWGCLGGFARTLAGLIQSTLTIVSLMCFFGVVAQVVDEKGGTGGSRATVGQRVGAGLLFGGVGLTCAYVAILIGDADRIGRARRGADTEGDAPRAG